MPTPGIRLGVDFGTSNTVAVVRWPDGRSRPLLFDGSPLLPSAVYVEPSGTIIVGRDAVHSSRLEPARFEQNPKRRIDEGTVLLGDREVPVNELIATVLRRVRDEWVRAMGDAVPEVTVTFPASWGATRRLSVADAAAAAGLGRVRLVPEPVAAAAYFTQVLGRDVPVGSVVVVHDFGAGTFDASVVARTAGGFEVLAVDGRDDIGGIDVDNAIVAHLGSICQPRDAASWQRLMSPQTVEERRFRRLLWDDARVAKERLSRQPAADLTVPLLNIDVHLTREELERLAQPLLEQTVRVTQGVMQWAQLGEGRVAGVFLVGGSSRMPLVGTLLHRALGAAPAVIEQPELVVAEGSMLAGSTAIPVSAAPAPGPATGVIPQVPGFDWRPAPGSPGAPVSGPPVGAGSPVSAPPVGVGGPVSGPPAGVDGLLWPAAGTFEANAPVSATPMSGGPMGAPPAGGYPAGPVSVPPAGAYPAGPTSPPSGNQPVPGGNQGAPGGNQGVPGGHQAAPGGFQAAPPGGYQAPPPGGYQAPPPGGYQAPPPGGYQAPPASGYQAAGNPAPPGNYGAMPVSGPPAGYAGQLNAPVSAPPNRPVSSGRVFVSSGVEPSTRYDEYGKPVNPGAAPPPIPVVRAQTVPGPPPAGVRGPERQPGRGPFARAMIMLFVSLLLVATPVIAGYVSYYLTTDEWPPPVSQWVGK